MPTFLVCTCTVGPFPRSTYFTALFFAVRFLTVQLSGSDIPNVRPRGRVGGRRRGGMSVRQLG